MQNTYPNILKLVLNENFVYKNTIIVYAEDLKNEIQGLPVQKRQPAIEVIEAEITEPVTKTKTKTKSKTQTTEPMNQNSQRTFVNRKLNEMINSLKKNKIQEESFNNTFNKTKEHNEIYKLTDGQKEKLKIIFDKLKENNCPLFKDYEFLIN